ncbi:hypothetical protein, partial [Ligilactobacillus salivarius]
NKEKLETAILLLKMAREQLDLKFSDFNQTRFKDEIKESRRLQADILRDLKNYSVFEELRENKEEDLHE